MPPSPLTQQVTEYLRTLLSNDPDPRVLEDALRYLAKWRSVLIENELTKRHGREVLTGPFAGLNYGIHATEGAAPARLIGCYEASLQPVFEEIIAEAYPVVMDVGCAEGFYAVGLARRMPNTRIRAHDINPKARETCATLAGMNGVTDRIEIGGEVDHAGFDPCAEERTLVLCDIEGAEEGLLDPQKAQGLVHADILVEVHDCFSPGLCDRLQARFEATHEVVRIDREVDMTALPDWMEGFSDLDRVLALWEWRMGPTPWLWMKTRQAPGGTG